MRAALFRSFPFAARARRGTPNRAIACLAFVRLPAFTFRFLSVPLQSSFMSELYKQLRADIIAAVKARDTDKALVLRTTDGAIQRAIIDQNVELDDKLVIAVLRKAVKDLESAKEQFARGGRDDLVSQNEREIAWLEGYLPAQMELEAIEGLIKTAIAETGAENIKDMGKVMGMLKKHPEASLIDFGAASKLIREKLG
jgi:uncharacterized protein YqeY